MRNYTTERKAGTAVGRICIDRSRKGGKQGEQGKYDMDESGKEKCECETDSTATSFWAVLTKQTLSVGPLVRTRNEGDVR